MPHSFKLARRIARLRAPVIATLLFTLIGCNDTDSLNPDSSTPASQGPGTGAQVAPATESAPALAVSQRGDGIPIGVFAMPTSEFGDRYNGAMRNIAPHLLRRELGEIKARGGKVVLMFAGPEWYYQDGAGHFSMSKWENRIDRFKGIDFDSYINDGTIIGHYLIDEPYDPVNWHGRPISGSVLEEMARYSKQRWPNMATIVRAEPDRIKWNGRYRYLDAAWAQYERWRGDPDKYLRESVADAQDMGLALVVGLNLLKGARNVRPMTANEVESLGSAMLASTYPCAFISWKYNSSHLSSGGVKDAMDVLRRKAENRSAKTCKSP